MSFLHSFFVIKKFSFVFALFLFLSLVSANFYGESNVTVVVDGDAPNIVIFSPGSINYGEGAAIVVNYSISDQSPISFVWYSLNFTNNITISGPFSLSLGKGNYSLRIYANDSLRNSGFSEVLFSVNNEALFCGDNFCSNNLAEDCNSCSVDCGSCPAGEGGSGGGGGGGIGIKPTAGNVTNETDSSGGETVAHVELSDGLSFTDIAVGEDGKAIIVDLYGNSYQLTFALSENGDVIAKVLNGDFIIPRDSVLPISLGDREMYVGLEKADENSARVVFGLDSNAVRDIVNGQEQDTGSTRTGLNYALLSVILLVVVSGIIIFLYYLKKSSKNKVLRELAVNSGKKSLK